MIRVISLFYLVTMSKMEEASIMTAPAVVSNQNGNCWSGKQCHAFDLFFSQSPAFYSDASTASDGLQEFRFIMDHTGVEHQVITAFLAGRQTEWWKDYFGTIRFYASTSSVAYDTASDVLCGTTYDTSFVQLGTSCKGSTFVITRTAGQLYEEEGKNKLFFAEVRFYQTPNLLKELEGATSIYAEVGNTSDSSWNDIGRLITNLDNRSIAHDARPMTSTGFASYNSCFEISNDTVEAASNRIAFTVDLKKSYFIHAILLVES